MHIHKSLHDAHPTASDPFPTLPDGMERDGFIRLFQGVAKAMFGLTDTEILSFTTMAQDPRPSDWKRGDLEPCCWRQQTEVANLCRKSRHTVRRHEARLVKAGLVDKRAMAHGARSGFVGCGIFFSPAIGLVPEMLAFQADQMERDAARRLLCNLRSVHKGHFTSALAALMTLQPDHPEAGGFAARFATWPAARDLRRLEVEALRSHVEDADGLTQHVLEALQRAEDLHHRGFMGATPYIQDTTQDPSIACNDNSPTLDPCEETKDVGRAADHKNEFHLKLGGMTIFRLCSQDLQLYLEGRMGGRREPTAHDLDCAVQMILPDLGINVSAWSEACATMGRDVATMCVIITDANRDHPQIRVRNPGGYLRGMTNAFRSGTLNIMGSLISLSERRANERQTKTDWG